MKTTPESKHAAYTREGQRCGSFTKPHPQKVKNTNRRRNKAAKQQRKINR